MQGLRGANPVSRETIFALSTAPGRAAIAVVRLSGVRVPEIWERFSRRPLPPARRAVLTQVSDPQSGVLIDRCLALYFAAPASETGEDLLEFQLHGGRSVIEAMLHALGREAGCRLAEPGEFARRAFENGKLDLTAVEGLADLIDAETEAQRKQALRQRSGELGKRYSSWRDRLVRALAHAEAAIDFPDEELPDGIDDHARSVVADVVREIAAHLNDGGRGERLRTGLEIAIIGAPNAGKSTLLNRLAGRDAAIVSARAGTTRDVVEVQLVLGGYPVTLADTAGLREARTQVEREGIRRSRERAAQADLTIVLIDATSGPEVPDALDALIDERAILVINKIDVTPADLNLGIGGLPLLVSLRTGEGVEALIEALTQRAASMMGVGQEPLITRARHREALTRCHAALEGFLAHHAPELAGEELRIAVRELGRITGAVDVEDLLDLVFREFCIGK